MVNLEGTMDIWHKIDAAEGSLLSGMYKEAASQASSIIRLTYITTEVIGEHQMRESAGMVFVQSMKKLGRTSELFGELRILFGSVAEIPVQVFLYAVCMHISEGLLSSLGSIFEEFFSTWAYSEGEGCAVRQAKPQSSENTSLSGIPVEKYLEVAELYAITFLGVVSHNPETAISWTEKALLPEGNRQDMLRRLCLMRSAAKPSFVEVKERNEDPACNGSTSSFREGLSKTMNPQSYSNRDQVNSTTGKSILPKIDHMSERINPCLGWFRTVRLRYGNVQLVVPRGKTMLMGLLLFFAYSFYRKRSAALKQTVARRISSVRKVLTDAWQLAFSVNVNPLAAVQQLPSAPHGSR